MKNQLASLSRPCSVTGQTFQISAYESRLLNHFNLSLPTRSPFERWLCSLGQSTPFVFRRTICPVTKQPILSRWSEDGKIKGVSADWFWSDVCDNTAAGQEFDFSRPFFEQFCEVAAHSYAPAMTRVDCENSPYVNASYHLKDSHLCFACEQLQDCMYCALCAHSSDLLLCSGVTNSQLCYYCLDSERLYGCRNLQDCEGCTDCYWCRDCIGCMNCFQCFGMRQARDGYYVRNQQVSGQVWKQTLREAGFGSYAAEQRLAGEAELLFSDTTYAHSFGNEDCSAVYRVSNSKDCTHAMYSKACHDCSGIIFSHDCRDCHCAVWARSCEGCYYVLGAERAYDCMYCDGVAGGARNQAYCFCCYNGCNDLLGCFFLKKKTHCILNKQYSPEEYAVLRPKVIEHMKKTGEWGQWFPPQLYGVPYNQSWAHFFLAELDDAQIAARGLTVSQSDPFRRTESTALLPDHIAATEDKLCGKELCCLKTARPYSFSQQELRTFKKHSAPAPRVHWAETLSTMQRQGSARARAELNIVL